MNDQTLWTSGTAVVVAFFTTVIAQYVFAPTLEARKQTLLDRSKVASGIADDIRAMHFQLVLATTKLFKLNDAYQYTEHSQPFDELSETFDAVDSLKHSGLKSRYVNLALSTQIEADIFSMYGAQSSREEYARLMRILDHTAKALDPACLPWTRRFHCWQGTKALGITRRPSVRVEKRWAIMAGQIGRESQRLRRPRVESVADGTAASRSSPGPARNELVADDAVSGTPPTTGGRDER